MIQQDEPVQQFSEQTHQISGAMILLACKLSQKETFRLQTRLVRSHDRTFRMGAARTNRFPVPSVDLTVSEYTVHFVRTKPKSSMLSMIRSRASRIAPSFAGYPGARSPAWRSTGLCTGRRARRARVVDSYRSFTADRNLQPRRMPVSPSHHRWAGNRRARIPGQSSQPGYKVRCLMAP
jgi:hypothetical protein